MNGQQSRKIIIDTDAGLDDAQAILMALASDDVEVVAITTVMGNTGAHRKLTDSQYRY
jgi:inosine-uridine nucleoside N-ribohydrolase